MNYSLENTLLDHIQYALTQSRVYQKRMEQLRGRLLRAPATETLHVSSESDMNMTMGQRQWVLLTQMLISLDPKGLKGAFEFNPGTDIFSKRYLLLVPLFCLPHSIFH